MLNDILLIFLRCGSKTEGQNGEDRKDHHRKSQKICKNATNHLKQQEGKKMKAKVMWIQIADI